MALAASSRLEQWRSVAEELEEAQGKDAYAGELIHTM